MAKLWLKGVRYIKCYGELRFGTRPQTIESAIDYCVAGFSGAPAKFVQFNYVQAIC